jgi:LysM repeat protein
MNDTKLNTELLSADAHGRKHIPFAVFAVILVHIILFVVLLIAAGCRAKARAKRLLEQNMARRVEPVQPAKMAEAGAVMPMAAGSSAAASLHQEVVTEGSSAAAPLHQGAVARDSSAAALLNQREARSLGKMRQKAGRSAGAASADAKRGLRLYVVRSGDTVWKIARELGTTIQAIKMENNLKDDLLHPGQKLRVSSEKQQKRSNEA